MHSNHSQRETSRKPLSPPPCDAIHSGYGSATQRSNRFHEKYSTKLTRCHGMKHKIAITLATMLFSMNAMAQSDASDVLISVEYGSADADYEISGTDYDGDLDLFVVSARYYLSDSAYFRVGSSSGDGTISNVSFDSTGLSVGAGAVLLGRVNYKNGSGQEIRVGLNYSDTEVSTATTTSDSTSTNVSGGYTTGLGDGFTASASVSADSDGTSVGGSVTKHIANGVLVGLSYGVSDSDLDGADTAETSTIGVGLGYSF